MKEIWKQSSVEPNYQISNMGKVQNIKYGTMMKTRFSKVGYERVTLYPSNKTWTIHRLVALEFLEKKEYVKNQINHIDGNKANNKITNLEWVTPSENVKHSYRTGLKQGKRGFESHHSSFETLDEIKAVISMHNSGMKQCEIARAMNVSAIVIRKLTKGITYKKQLLEIGYITEGSETIPKGSRA